MRTSMRVGIACLLVVSATAVASATLPGDDGKLLYARWRDRGVVLRTIMPDGTDDRRADAPASVLDAAWSPDGSTIAFAVEDDELQAGIHLVDQGTGETTPVVFRNDIPNEPWFFQGLAFSPAGDELVFGVWDDGGRSLYTVGTDGEGLTRIPLDLDLVSPDWSSTGRIVATTEIADTERVSIYTMDPDGSNLDRVTRLPAPRSQRVLAGVSASWSPDGSQLAFTAQAGRIRTDVWVIDVDGTGLRRITDTPRRWEWLSAFSPEGDRIAYSRGGRKLFMSADLWIAGLHGGRHRLTETPRADEYAIGWQAA